MQLDQSFDARVRSDPRSSTIRDCVKRTSLGKFANDKKYMYISNDKHCTCLLLRLKMLQSKETKLSQVKEERKFHKNFVKASTTRNLLHIRIVFIANFAALTVPSLSDTGN